MDPGGPVEPAEASEDEVSMNPETLVDEAHKLFQDLCATQFTLVCCWRVFDGQLIPRPPTFFCICSSLIAQRSFLDRNESTLEHFLLLPSHKALYAEFNPLSEDHCTKLVIPAGG